MVPPLGILYPDIVVYGDVAEWLMAAVFKTAKGY